MKRYLFNLVIAVVVGGMTALNAAADGKIYAETNPTWKAECGSCHIAYPPRLLPASSWRAIMADLDRHFGVDASVDASAAKEIGAFLDANAGRKRVDNGAPVTRITETRWFIHEHDELPTRIWQSPSVKSAANCESCHTHAADGDFSKRTRRVPRSRGDV